MYYRSRYYQPEVGSFASQDSFAGDPISPASQNRFAYALGNPIRYSDPTGRTPTESWSATVAAGRAFLAAWLLVLVGAVCSIRGVERDCLAAVGTLLAGTAFWVSVAIGVLFLMAAIIQVIAYYRSDDLDLDLDWTVSFVIHLVLAAATLLMIEYMLTTPSTPARRFAAGFVIVSLLVTVYSELPKLLQRVRKSNQNP